MATQQKNEKNVGYVRDVITGIGRVAFPHLLATNEKGQYPSHKFEVHFLFEKTDTKTIETLRNAAIKAAKEKWPSINATDVKIGVRDGDEKSHLDGFAGHFFINPKSGRQPVMVGPDKKALPAGEKINGGDHVRLCVTAGCFPMNLEKETAEALKGAGKAVFSGKDEKGKTTYWRPAVTFYLDMVQKVKSGTPFGGGSANPDLFPEEAAEGLDGKPVSTAAEELFN